MMAYDGYGMWGGGPFMVLLWVVILVAVVALIGWLARAGMDAGTSRNTGPVDRSLEILRERYARGEIDREEYEQKRSDLEG